MIRAPTPAPLVVDRAGRPCFLGDVDLTLEAWRARVDSDDPDESAYWLARALRDAKPDDVLEWVDWDRIAQAWPRMERFLGPRREFWVWWLARVGRAVE